jgi:hypothetical protein
MEWPRTANPTIEGADSINDPHMLTYGVFDAEPNIGVKKQSWTSPVDRLSGGRNIAISSFSRWA